MRLQEFCQTGAVRTLEDHIGLAAYASTVFATYQHLHDEVEHLGAMTGGELFFFPHP